MTETKNAEPKLIMIGLGGGGGNAVEDILRQGGIAGVETMCANTDAQALKLSSASFRIQLGNQITKGLGAGANPSIGRQAAEEDREQIERALMGADMVFITAGMGGGTGTGSAPVVAQIAKEMGILTVAVVTKPFSFEGRQRMQVAEQGIRELAQYVDSLITIPNNKLLSVLGRDMTLMSAFKAANNVLFGAVSGIAELITKPGFINVDFADVCTVMKQSSQNGVAMIGTASASGEGRAKIAAQAAVASPLLEDINLSGAKGVLINITASPEYFSIGEFEQVGEVIKEFTSEQAVVVVGTVIDPSMGDELRVTVVATGLGSDEPVSSGPTRHLEAYKSSLSHDRYERPAAAGSSVRRSVPPMAPVHSGVKKVADDLSYLDIPAFLRKQEEEV